MDKTPESSMPEHAPVPPVPEREPLAHRAFVGPSGIRAGWRLLIYVAGCYVLYFLTSVILSPFLPEIPPGVFLPPRLFLAVECQRLVVVVFAALIMARLEKRSFGIYGLPSGSRFQHLFWLGVLWGLVGITLLLGIMRAAGVFYFGSVVLHRASIFKFGVFWGILFLIVGLGEEFGFRGYTQFTLTTGIGFWPSAFLLSATFGAIHLGNKGEGWMGALGAACIGLFFCLTLRRTGSLWFAVGMHAAWDWGETFLYAVPDSGIVEPGHLLRSTFRGSVWLTGGSVGPEGSVLLFVVIAALWISFDRLYPEVKYKVAE